LDLVELQLQELQISILELLEATLILEHLANQLAVNLITFLQKVVEVVEKEPLMEDLMVVLVVVLVAATQVQYQMVPQRNQEQTQVLL
tara:strand:+ start:65 stop:328 length:264 start_codon:yes stop_codon:yes gene_type:complete